MLVMKVPTGIVLGDLLSFSDADDGEQELSGKAGGSYPRPTSCRSTVSVCCSMETNSYGTKAGVKYNFWIYRQPATGCEPWAA